jgi:two-component system chemotaxis response regulator CheY
MKILIVDDSEFILQRLQLLLTSLDKVKEVKLVTSAEEGMQSLIGFQPDIVILDINLPGKNGLQMLKDIRAMEHIDPVVVIFTNNTLSGYKAESLLCGADYFLDKARDFHSIPSIIEKTSENLRVKAST